MTVRRWAAALLLLGACSPLADARATRIEAEYPPQGRAIHVGDAVIRADIRGRGPDVILIHGANGSARDMASLAERLAQKYRVIAFDRPGLGYSSDLGIAGDSPLVQAEYLRAAAAQLGVRDPIVVGHSYGGAVAMGWALREPRTKGVVILSGAVLPWEGGRDWLYGLTATPVAEVTVQPLASAFMPDWLMDRTVRTLFAPQVPPKGYADSIGADLALRPQTLRTNLRQLNRLKPYLWRMAPHYRELTLPIEILHGTEDKTVSLKVHSAPMTELPNVHLTRLPGVGHMVHHVAQDAVVAAVDRIAAARR